MYTLAHNRSQKIFSISTRCAEIAYKARCYSYRSCEHSGWAERHFAAHLLFFSTLLSHTFPRPQSLRATNTHTCHHKTGCVVKSPVTMLVSRCHTWALSAVPHGWTTINPAYMLLSTLVHALTHANASTHSFHFLSLFLTATALLLPAHIAIQSMQQSHLLFLSVFIGWGLFLTV